MTADAVGVAVVGSVNLDVVLAVDRRPGPGETVAGTDAVEVIGGKGANQAMAAAREARTAMVAALGTDAAGDTARIALERGGVDIQAVRTSTRATGRAYITLTPDGENSIVVVPLANADLTPAHVLAALDRLRPAVVLCQLEVPLASVNAAADWCDENSARFVLNPSPVADVNRRLLARADPLIVNRHEAALLGGGRGADARELAGELAGMCRSVIVTDGARGAYAASGGTIDFAPAPTVTAVDTTGAGDAFAGVVAARLAGGDPLPDAAARAVATASRIVQLARSER